MYVQKKPFKQEHKNNSNAAIKLYKKFFNTAFNMGTFIKTKHINFFKKKMKIKQI